MKTKSHHHLFQSCSPPRWQKIDLTELADKSIRPIGTFSFVAGIGAAAMGMSPISDTCLRPVCCSILFPGLATGGKATDVG